MKRGLLTEVTLCIRFDVPPKSLTFWGHIKSDTKRYLPFSTRERQNENKNAYPV